MRDGKTSQGAVVRREGVVSDSVVGRWCLMLAGISLAHAAVADDVSFTVGGLAFGDAYHNPSHHLESGDGATGAVLRRGYLTLDAQLGSRWDGRLRLEANQSGEFETCDFEVDLKDVYLGYTFGQHRVAVGLQPTPTFDVIESAWGKRYLMRTPADLQGLASRDVGIALKGRLDDSFSYRVMVGTGADFGAESGDGAAKMLALNWKVNERWTLDFYVDHERRPGETDVATGQVFAAYSGDSYRAGFQYIYRDRQSEAPGELASTYLVWETGRRSNLIGRIDRVSEPSLRGDNIAYIPFDPTAKATMFLAGWEHRLSEHFRVTPNAIVTTYDRNDEGIRPQTDIYLRVTFFLDFE